MIRRPPRSTLCPYTTLFDLASPTAEMKTIVALVVLLCVLFAGVSAHSSISKKSLKCAACGYFVNEISERTAGLIDPVEIHVAVFSVCSSINDDKFQAKCSRFLTRHGEQIVDRLIKGESLDGFCKCEAKMPVELSTKYCAICQFLVSELENAARNNEPALIKVLERACTVLPNSYRTTCEGIIETFGPMIIEKFLNAATPEKVCSKLHLCPATKNVAPETPVTPEAPVTPMVEDGLQCEFCQFVINYVQQHLADPTNQEAVERVLQNICKVIPKQMEDQCEMIIKTYYPVLIEYITQNLPAEVVCQKIKLCTSTKLIDVVPTVDPAVDSDLGCTVCKYLMKILQNFITGDETAEQLEQLLHKACGYLPNSLERQCNSLIDVFGPQLVQWIIQNGVKHLDEFCVAVDICPKKEVVVAESNLKCAVCEYIVAFLEERLKDDVTQQRIEQLLEEVCHRFPTSIQSQCTAVVSIYTPVIIDWFVNKYPADKLCAQLKLCTTSEFQAVAKPGQYCAICQFVMQYVVDYIAKDATEEKIIAAVEKVCKVFPKSLVPTCQAFVETYGPQLIEALLKKETPEVICQQIRACVSAVVEKEPEQASFLCSACEFAMVELEQFLSQNRTQQEITEFLKRVCDLIPENVRGMCHVLVDLELPNILEWIKTIPPNQVCTAIGACKRQARASPIEFIAMNQIRA